MGMTMTKWSSGARSLIVVAVAHAMAIGLGVAGCTADQKVRCGAGTELVAGKCVPLGADGDAGPDANLPTAGSSPRVCGDNAIESDGGCVGLRPIGAACDSGAQCSSGTCLSEDRGAVGGYCTVIACNDNRPCPAGSRCHFSSTEESFLCLSYCDDDKDCRDEYACQPLYTSDASVCAPSCVNSGACPSGTRCDSESGKCLLHECELGASDACASTGDAGMAADAGSSGELVCYADRLGLSASGAVCLPSCDPEAAESNCPGNEVCQPLPEDPERLGLCVPPLCEHTEDCSPGAQCMDGVCQPPARCDEDGDCADDEMVCVGGSGGQCMPACRKDDECSDLHAGLSCARTLGACLPTGSFPGSACEESAPCAELKVTDDDGDETTTEMVCQDGVCLASCADGGSGLCADISSTLTCAKDIFEQPLCVPKGSFPGGPCDADDECDELEHGKLSIEMACERDQCLITCDDHDAGDELCESIDASLVCTADAFGSGADLCLPRGAYPGGPCAAGEVCDAGMTCEDSICLYECATGGEALCNDVSEDLSCASGVFSEPVCLPRGSYPGSPCRDDVGDECDQNLGGLPDANLTCVNDLCVVQCEALTVFVSGDALCGTVSAGLSCVSSAGLDVCAPDCSDGGQAVCDAVGGELACAVGIDDDDVCLPAGSFPGGPCAEGDLCAQDVGGSDSADMICNSGTCVFQCEIFSPAPSGDFLCGAINAALTCVASPTSTDFCTTACVGAGNACLPGYSCLLSEDACLPDGSFLGSACAGGTACSATATPALTCLPGGSPVCAAACAPAGASPYCQAVAAGVGTTYDTCADGDPGAGEVLICVDGTP
jgi:hypothetical protein